jgi:hypothetical protein
MRLFGILIIVALQSVPTFQITGQPRCRSCKVVLEPEVRLGAGLEEGGPMAFSDLFRSPAGFFYIAPTAIQGTFEVYDQRGALVQRVGRSGRGPREFGSTGPLFAGRADTVYVVDRVNGRLTAFVRGATWANSLPIATVARAGFVLPNGDFVVADRRKAPDGRLQPVHVLDRTGSTRVSFGADKIAADKSPVVQATQYIWADREIAKAANGNIWVAHQNQYELRLYDPSGKLLRVLTRQVDWFKSYTQIKPGDHPPRLADIAEDANGLLWVLLTIQNSAYAPPKNWDTFKPLTPNMVDEKLDTIIEVLDPKSGVLLASLRLKPHFRELLAPDRIARLAEDADGLQFFDIYRLRLVR